MTRQASRLPKPPLHAVAVQSPWNTDGFFSRKTWRPYHERTISQVQPLPFIVLATIASRGCDIVVWLPDSGGIIYTTTDWPGLEDSVLYAKGTSGPAYSVRPEEEVGPHDGESRNEYNPACSEPNGKQIAVARIDLEKDKQPTL